MASKSGQSGEMQTLEEKQARGYFHRYCTEECTDCLFFLFFFSLLTPFIISWKTWNLYFSMNMQIFKKHMAIPLKAYSNHYWEKAMSKVGRAKINIFQSLKVKQSFRRVRNQTFHREWIIQWFYFLLQDLNQPQARHGTRRAAEKSCGSRRDLPMHSRTSAFSEMPHSKPKPGISAVFAVSIRFYTEEYRH